MQKPLQFTSLIDFVIYLAVLALTIASFSVYPQSQNTPQQTTNEWQKLLNKQQFDRLISTSNAILQIDTNNQDALFYQGLAYYHSEREDLAIPFFTSLINQHHQQINHIGHYRLALSHFYLNNNQQAIELLNTILTESYPPAKTQETLAYALAKNNQFTQAAEVFSQLLAKQATYSLHYNRAMVYWELNDLAAAEKDLKSAIALNENFQLPYFDLISIYVAQNKTVKAYNWLEMLLKKREVNLSRLQQDPTLTDFTTSEQYQALLTQYNM